MENSKSLFAIFIGLVAVGLVVWLLTQGQMSGKKQSLKVGVISTLTGVGAFQGQQELRGLELAREEIDREGGVNGRSLELIPEDSATDSAKAVNALQKLINVDQVKFVIGDSWSSTTEVLISIANENHILLISPMTTLDQLSQDDFFFRTMPKTRDMMFPLAHYAYEKMGVRRVAILRQQTPFGVEHANDFREEFKKLGGEIVGEESFLLTADDVRSEITKIKGQNPDAILNLHATSPRLGLLMKQAQELGLTDVKWLGSFGSENHSLISEYGSVANGITYPYSYDGKSDEPSVQKFVAAYQAKYNELPDIGAANAYDALKLLVKAIAQSGEDPAQVKAYLSNLKNYSGASGTFSFDQNGDVKKPIIIKEIHDNEFRVLRK